jgi:hypothetical protein
VIAGERIYALERSQKLNGAGILKWFRTLLFILKL